MKFEIVSILCESEFLARPGWRLIALWTDRDGNRRAVGLLEIQRANSDSWAWIQTVFVEPEFRRFGAAKALIGRAIEEAPKRFPKSVGVCAGIYARNVLSRRIFEGFGFRHVYDFEEGVMLYSRSFTIDHVVNALELVAEKAGRMAGSSVVSP